MTALRGGEEVKILRGPVRQVLREQGRSPGHGPARHMKWTYLWAQEIRPDEGAGHPLQAGGELGYDVRRWL
jgi:hypothetical protein